ncbi:hypothetical protein FDZ73_21740 [bacterium]|nr:MAG: hypothetical protein FDZ73_21740 [bacterium]
MAEVVNIDRELNNASGILSDVETLDLPWSESELAGFDWFLAVGSVKRLLSSVGEMSERQKNKFEDLRQRMDSVKEKLKVLNFENPFEDEKTKP